MIQFILILLGLIFPGNENMKDNTVLLNPNTTNYTLNLEDTSGETGQILPPKKSND